MANRPDRKIGPSFQITSFRSPQLPMGQEGVAKVIELVTDATLAAYPSVDGNRLITRPEQLHPLAKDKLEVDRLALLGQLVLPRYFQLLGFSDKDLKDFNPSTRIRLFSL